MSTYIRYPASGAASAPSSQLITGPLDTPIDFTPDPSSRWFTVELWAAGAGGAGSGTGTSGGTGGNSASLFTGFNGNTTPVQLEANCGLGGTAIKGGLPGNTFVAGVVAIALTGCPGGNPSQGGTNAGGNGGAAAQGGGGGLGGEISGGVSQVGSVGRDAGGGGGGAGGNGTTANPGGGGGGGSYIKATIAYPYDPSNYTILIASGGIAGIAGTDGAAGGAGANGKVVITTYF